jgi:two-component system sensor histidine kinase KdpD
MLSLGRSTPLDPAENEPEERPRDPRVVGLRAIRAYSLESVERHRLQLWIVSAVLLVSVSLGFALLTLWPNVRTASFISPTVLRAGIVLLSLAFCAYALEKEIQLRKLSKLLWDERVLTAALTGRLHEVSLLLDAGKAMNSMLDLPAVLETILGGATELLAAESGSIMLREGDELVCTAVQGNEAARDTRVRIGEGIAGRVAADMEPLLIEGRLGDPSAVREKPVDSAVSVPLIHRQELLGVLNVNAGLQRSFTEYDLRAMSLFAEQAASAIANARLYETEQRRVAELVELDRMKRDFVATVSHELRTPLTSIVAAAKTAKRSGSEWEQDEFWDIVARQADRLSGTVEDILDAAKIDERTNDPGTFRVATDLASLARIAVADPENAERLVEVEAPASAVGFVDPHAIRRVLDELVDNACRYGSPPVRVVVTEDDDHVVITVSDRGPGVPAHSRERIFERFSRLDRDRDQPGIGLGLPIVRALVRSSGGDIRAEDAPEGGAAFVVSLPRREEVAA